MRRLLIVPMLLLLASGAVAQDFIRNYPLTYQAPISGTSAFFTGPLSIGGSTGSPFANLYGDAANTLALRNGGTAGAPVPQTFNIYNFCDGAACATGYERLAPSWFANTAYLVTQKAGTGSDRGLIYGSSGGQWQITPAGSNIPQLSDSYSLGGSTNLIQTLYSSRSIQGSKSKAVVDATPTAIWTITVADDDYEACDIGWTAYAEDADTDARQVRRGRTQIAILNTSGAETCGFSTDGTGNLAVNVTAGTLTCAFTCTAGADLVTLNANCDTSLNAAAETLTFESRLDCNSTTTVTPQ